MRTVQTPLGELCRLITDGKHGDCENQQDSGFFFLSAKDVRDGKLNYNDARQITETDFLDTHRRTQLEPDDLVISNSGTIGRMALVKNQPETSRTTFQKSVAILKPKHDRVLASWLYYFLHFDIERLISFAGGTAQKNLLLRDLRAFSIAQQPLPTQRKIAGILSAYDDLIENNTRRIAILEAMAQAIYRAWFVDFRFPGHEQVKSVDSPLGKIPEGWTNLHLSQVADVNAQSLKRGKEPEELNYVDIASVSTGKIDEVRLLPFSEAPGRARRIVRHGDIIWSTVRPNRKSYSLILNPLKNMIASTGFAVISGTKAPFTYLYHALTTEEFVSYLVNHATGSAYPAVNSSDFEKASILVPSQDVLAAFHDVTNGMFLLKHNLQEKNRRLRNTRELLLPKLISGQLDVEDLDIDTGEAVTE